MRGVFFAPLVLAYTVVLGGPALIAAALDPTGRLPHGFARLWSRLILWTLGIRVLVFGQENLTTAPAVLVANHTSVLDIPVLFGYVPETFRIIHKRSLYRMPLIGWYLRLAGHVSIDRGRAFSARRSLERAAERIRHGTSVVAFPEGTRSKDGSIGRFKRGTFVLARSAGVPVIPVSIVGVKAVVPGSLLSVRPGVVRIKILPPMPPGNEEDAETLAGEVRSAVVAACAGEAS